LSRFFLFSDSVIIISHSCDSKSVESFILYCTNFLYFCFEQGIPIKGAVSYGLFTADYDNSIFFGQPLIDAFLLQEELQFYGCIMDSNFEREMDKFSSLKDFIYDFVISYRVPTKSGIILHKCINWLSMHSHFKKDSDREEGLNFVKQFYYQVSGKPRLYVDNTMQFAEYCIDIISKNS
jgi:hypothetical protein